MSILKILERGDVINVDGNLHPAMPDVVQKYEVISTGNVEIRIRALDSDLSTNYLIFSEESDCIQWPGECINHGQKLYHDSKGEWICPHCEI